MQMQMLRSSTRSLSARVGRSNKLAVLMNKDRVDFDGRLDMSKLRSTGVALRTFGDDYEGAGDITRRAEGAHVLVTKEVPVPAEAIRSLPESVELICEAGTGFNNIDLLAASERGITVCNVPEYSTDAMAQLVITSILNFSCGMAHQQRLLARGDRSNFATLGLTHEHFELAGKTLGLVGGNGAIGRRVTQIASCLGMEVLSHSRTSELSLEDMLRAADFVSVHCPLTDQTRGLLDASKLALLKPSAYLVNTARGAIVDEADLLAALDAGKLAGAALDVQYPEPPQPDSRLYTHERVVLTPHIGWKRLETRQRLVDAVADNVAAYLAGAPTNVVSQPRVRKAGLELEEVQGLRVRLNEPRIREERGRPMASAARRASEQN